MSNRHPKLSRNWQISGKPFEVLVSAKIVLAEVPEYLEFAHLTQNLQALLFWKVYLDLHDVWWMPQIIYKITDFWKIVLGLSQC